MLSSHDELQECINVAQSFVFVPLQHPQQPGLSYDAERCIGIMGQWKSLEGGIGPSAADPSIAQTAIRLQCSFERLWKVNSLAGRTDPHERDVSRGAALRFACGKGGQWTLALEVLQEMKRKMRPSNASYSATISACEKAFRWREALALLEEAHAVRPQLSCFNAAISACEKCHKISFNACISACAGESIWTIALHLLQQMPRCQLTPGAITRSAVITACEKALQWQVVLKILDQPGFGRGSATELHQAMWYLSKQAPSSQTQLKALQGAREATGLVDEFKVKQLVSLLRSFASMLGVVWSLNYAGVLSQRFLDFAHQTLYQLTELEGCFAMEPVRSSSINAGLPLLLETGDVAVLQKPAGWQVDDGHQNTAEDVSLLSTLVRSMTSLRRFHLLSDSAFSHGFLHRLDVPTSGLILVAKTHRAFYDMRLQLASGLLKREPRLSWRRLATTAADGVVRVGQIASGPHQRLVFVPVNMPSFFKRHT
eukprot:g27631.t1